MNQVGFRIIAARRRQEEKTREIQSSIEAEKKAMGVANFEIKTTAKIDARASREKVESERRRKNVELHERRTKLAGLYNSEMDKWKDEILSRVETKEERKARIMERAYELKDQREKDRLEYVQKAYDNRWRDACDDARTLDSQAMALYMDQQRHMQIEEKLRRRQAVTAEEMAFLQYINRFQADKDEAERRKQENRALAERSRASAITEQISQNRERRLKALDESKLEDAREIEEIRAAIAAEEEVQRRRQDEDRQRRFDVLQQNAKLKEMEERRQALDRKQDEFLLKYAMDKETDVIASENYRKNANRAAAGQYRRYLEEQMQKEAEDNSALDDIRRIEEEKVWKARDDALSARENAREELRRMVDIGRQEQIEMRRRQLALEEEEGRLYATRFIEEAKEGIEIERGEERRRREVGLSNRRLVEQQIEEHRQKNEKEKQDAYLEDKHMKHMERVHQQRLTEQGGTIRLFRPLKQSQWYS